jgi:hypothetical protein
MPPISVAPAADVPRFDRTRSTLAMPLGRCSLPPRTFLQRSWPDRPTQAKRRQSSDLHRSTQSPCYSAACSWLLLPPLRGMRAGNRGMHHPLMLTPGIVASMSCQHQSVTRQQIMHPDFMAPCGMMVIPASLHEFSPQLPELSWHVLSLFYQTPRLKAPAFRHGDESRAAVSRCLHRWNVCAILPACARAMNPCLVAFGPWCQAPSQPNVRGVLAGKLPPGKTFAVIRGFMGASKYLGASAPSSSGGHPASSSRKREAPGL